MKGVVIILLSVFYLFVSAGTSINLHYCGGKLKNVSFHSFDEKSCCGSKMKSKGCCHNQKIAIKVKDKQEKTEIESTFFISNVACVINSNLCIQVGKIYINIHKTPENYHAPPHGFQVPIYIKNRVFLI
ncbi:MAG: hypothetical protein HYR91_04410 [Flavobacteriia bacterium]|nr:hypothetical protein [Flavobacteriia bacterium]